MTANPHGLPGLLPALALGILAAMGPCHAASKTYVADSSDFSNPERGFWGTTLFKKYVDIGNWKSSALPQSLLDGLEKSFSDGRNAGRKFVLRFKYSNGGGGDPDLQQMLSHAEQLRPVLQSNSDVISILEAGFVGGWGEWWGSTSVNTAETRRQVLFKLLEIMPKDRMVALRYNFHKREIFGSNLPLTANEAFNGSNQARTAAHNDCFVTNEDNAGTYKQKGDGAWGLGYEAEKAYLSSDNMYVAQGGETCEVGSTAFASCDRALADLKQMKWDMLNNTFSQGVLNQWKAQGCYGEISRHLGYRLRLLDATFEDEVADGNLRGTIRLINEGYGKVYNPRKPELVLRNTANGSEHALALPNDPRFWSPGLEQTLAVNLPIPKSVPFGNYSLFLRLPDPAPKLYGNPRYSIRLANKDVWDPAKGSNSLGLTVKVSSFNPNPVKGIRIDSRQNTFVFRTVSGNRPDAALSIDLQVGTPGPVHLAIHDLRGGRIMDLARDYRGTGSYSLTWNGKDRNGMPLSAGAYLATVSFGGVTRTERILLR